MGIWRARTRLLYAMPLAVILWLLAVQPAGAQTLPVLQRGDRGGAVAEAQRVLKTVGVHPGSQDGIFGPRTEQAVRMFQRNQSLAADGVIGRRTWRALYSAEERVTRVRPGSGRPLYAWPSRLRRISSRFGPRPVPCSGCSDFHQGVDFPGPIGEPVQAARGGRVRFGGWAQGYGNVIYVDHTGGHQTRYAHLNDIWVRSGHQVRRGQTIGGLGKSGIGTGPHLHFELRLAGRAVDPLPYLVR